MMDDHALEILEELKNKNIIPNDSKIDVYIMFLLSYQ